MDWPVPWRWLRSLGRRVDTALHRSGLRTRWVTTPPPAHESYVGWHARWLGPTSMWCRTPGDVPDIEISQGTEGTVTEFVVADRAGGRVYRIAFDNGALFSTYLPAPWAIALTAPNEPPCAS
ncbi:MAG: hypothetical protein ACT4NY_05265 [Pseudonocardiales bacterium]